jgi:hypothetical protein
MARSAMLAGRTLADMASSLLAVAVLTGTGLLVGWTVHASVASVAAGVELGWCAAILLVTVPLAVRGYRARAGR